MSANFGGTAASSPAADALRRVAGWLCVLGVATLACWRPIAGVFSAKPSDVLLGLGVLIGVTAAVAMGPRSRAGALPPLGLRLVLAALLASLLVATAVGYVRDHFALTYVGILLLGRILVLTALFTVLFLLIRIDEFVRRRLVLALLVPVTLLLMAAIPGIADTLWAYGSSRFQGLSDNANTAAAGFVVALGIAATLGLDGLAGGRLARGLAYSLVAAGAVTLIVLTQSRAYLVAGCAAALVAAISVSFRRMTSMWLLAAAFLGFWLTVTVTVALGTPMFRQCFFARIAPPAVLTPTCTGLASSSTGSVLSMAQRSIPSGSADPHLWVARDVIRQLLTRSNFVLGFGLNYQRDVADAPGGAHRGINSILDVPVHGGVAAVLILVAFLVMLTRAVWSATRGTSEESQLYVAAAGAALAGLWVAGIFIGSPLFNYLFWVLASLALA